MLLMFSLGHSQNKRSKYSGECCGILILILRGKQNIDFTNHQNEADCAPRTEFESFGPVESEIDF